MPRYTLPILGLEISFKTDAEAERVEAARLFVEEQYGLLAQAGRQVSKEKLLTVLILSLADEYLQSKRRLRDLEAKLGSLLNRFETDDRGEARGSQTGSPEAHTRPGEHESVSK